MQIFVQTRGAARAADYCFLGRAPHSPWWRRYRDHTTFDYPTIIVHSDGTDWQAYLSGIPSARVDAVGTVVRYTVVLEGGCGDAETDANNRALALIAAWLADIGTGTAGGAVQAALDREFPGPVVEWLLTEEPEVGWPETRRRALAALESVPTADPAAETGPPSWFGNVRAPGPRAEFVHRTAGLLAGTAGRALFLNLISSPDDAAALAEDDLPAAILAEDVRGISTDRVAELNPKKAPVPPRSNHQVATRQTSLLVRWLAALVAGVRRWFP
ncbi:MAG TPA: hypothetical protein VFQ77_15440 [Pseudonocardiaceae bacterium]|nr:hypothetical protein [Pseudonocardiaceae bacterium]